MPVEALIERAGRSAAQERLARARSSRQAELFVCCSAKVSLSLKSTKNLCLGHRLFEKIRQIPPILLCFQAKSTESLVKSGARRTVQSQLKLYARRDAWYFSKAALYFCSSFLKIALKTKVVTRRITRYRPVNDIHA